MSKMTGLLLLLACLPLSIVEAQDFDSSKGDALLRDYFRRETAAVTDECLSEVKTLADWEALKTEYRRQLQEMLGLEPWPERTDLQPVVTATRQEGDIIVENLEFQSRPGLYVTANLYRPAKQEGQLPAVLYVCGHGRVVKDGISYGNKTHYHYHGDWYARHGYVCLMIDTIQLGEIEGVHHGTHNKGWWWWANRGYTPAGVEAWNGIRALDYLQSRPEVDPNRLGVTGRSGGGAYSWWIAALDERVKCAVPVAGITSMHNHIVDDCIEGHCDCMFMVNKYQWDFPVLAALVAPRPLLISNSDKDGIFPLDGVVDVHRKVRHIYELYGADRKLGLQITEGPHQDTQELRTHGYVWMERFLKGSEGEIDTRVEKPFAPEQLKVFETLPADELVTTTHEWFVPAADADRFPQSSAQFDAQSKEWVKELKEQSLRAWPEQKQPLDVRKTGEFTLDGLQGELYEFTSQEPYRLPLIVLRSAASTKEAPKSVTVHLLDDADWSNWGQACYNKSSEAKLPQQIQSLKDQPGTVYVGLAVRGIGPTEWTRNEKERTHILRRFLLLGQSLDGQRLWDVTRGLEATREILKPAAGHVALEGRGVLGGIAAHACLFDDQINHLKLTSPPTSYRDGPTLLNSSKVLEMPQVLLLAHARAGQVEIHASPADVEAWEKVQAAMPAINQDPNTFRLIPETE